MEPCAAPAPLERRFRRSRGPGAGPVADRGRRSGGNRVDQSGVGPSWAAIKDVTFGSHSMYLRLDFGTRILTDQNRIRSSIVLKTVFRMMMCRPQITCLRARQVQLLLNQMIYHSAICADI
jgi:hypothetical protein